LYDLGRGGRGGHKDDVGLFYAGAKAGECRCRVASAGGGDELDSFLACFDHCHRRGAVLETGGWFPAVILDPQFAQTQFTSQPRGGIERSIADGERGHGRIPTDGQQRLVAPDPLATPETLDSRLVDCPPYRSIVIHYIQRAVIPVLGADVLDLTGRISHPADEALQS
jgi:hypothetical protein